MKIFLSILTGILVSFYCYTVSFSFLPEILSSKNIVTLIGVVCYAIQSIRSKSFKLDFDIIMAGFIALLFSLSCLFSIMMNGTGDMTYVSYIKSFILWVFGAHGICSMIRMVHGRINIGLVCRYFIYVAVAQCILSQLIDNIPAVQSFIDGITAGGNSSVKEIGRLYGLGASLDTAGTRFAIAELLIAYLIADNQDESGSNWHIVLYYLSFFIILILGCIVSRTTTVGALIAICYFIFTGMRRIGSAINASRMKKILILILILAIVIPLSVLLYNRSADAREQIRFAFEGFFNWAETGVWRTDSTDKLNGTMWIWPHDRNGWIYGYGLFENWVYGTDIGYCRFILYCGIIGLSIFSFYFMFLAQRLAKRNQGTGMLSFMLLVLAFAIWLKVSTDIFLIFILLVSVNFVNNIFIDIEQRK